MSLRKVNIGTFLPYISASTCAGRDKYLTANESMVTVSWAITLNMAPCARGLPMVSVVNTRCRLLALAIKVACCPAHTG